MKKRKIVKIHKKNGTIKRTINTNDNMKQKIKHNKKEIYEENKETINECGLNERLKGK
jgi:hypothetical protein